MPSATARRPRVPEGRLSQHRLQHALVVGDRLSPAGRCVVHGVASRKIDAGDRLFGRGDGLGATDSERRPARSKAPITRGSPPASPQRLTSRPICRPCRATDAISRSTAGFSGSARSATAPMSRPAAVTYWVRSFEPIEKKSASKRSIGDRRGRHLDHDAELRARRRECRSRARLAMASSSSARAASSSVGHGHHRQHDAQVAVRRGARERAQLRFGTDRDGAATGECRERRGTDCFRRSSVTPWIGLSPPASSVRMVTGRPWAQATMRR